HCRIPHGRSAAEQRQDHPGEHRLQQEQQCGAREDGECKQNEHRCASVPLSRIFRPQSACGHRARRGVRVLRCHTPGGLVRWTEMELTEAEKLKARRAQLWLYLLIALMVTAP